MILEAVQRYVQLTWKRLAGVIKLAVAGGLVTYLISSGKIDASSLSELVSLRSALLAMLCGGTIIVAQLVRALRLRLILEATGIHVRWWDCVRNVLVGFFFNNFLPTAAGGDLVVGYRFAKSMNGRLPDIAGSLLYDRLLGMAALSFLASCALFSLWLHAFGFAWPGKLGWGFLGMACALSCSLPILALCRSESVLRVLQQVASRYLLLRPVTDLVARFLGVGFHKNLLVKCFGISCIMHILSCLALYLAGRAANQEVAMAQTILLGLPTFLLGIAPLSPGNIGWQEWFGYVVWSSQNLAFGASLWLIYRMIAATASLVGALVYASETWWGSIDESGVLSTSVGRGQSGALR